MGHFGGSFLFPIPSVDNFLIHPAGPQYESAPSSYFAPSVPMLHHLTSQHVQPTSRLQECPSGNDAPPDLVALSDPMFLIQTELTACCFLSCQFLSSGSGWAESERTRLQRLRRLQGKKIL